jgi:paraquat-inducible protein B
MHQESRYTMVGVFVVGAISLILIGAVYLYDAYLHSQIETYVMFFKGSLQGLEASAPVRYRGIKIGEVVRIEVTENHAKNRVDIPVYVQFFVEKRFGKHDNPIQHLIRNNFVANISSPNFISGRSEIDLISSNKPLQYPLGNYRKYPLFPTSQIVESRITMDETLETLKKTMQSIQNFMHSKDMKDTIRATGNMAKAVEAFVRSQNMQNTIKATGHMVKTIEAFFLHWDTQLPLVLGSFNQSLEEVGNASVSVQQFMDYLALYPESLLRGKK